MKRFEAPANAPKGIQDDAKGDVEREPSRPHCSTQERATDVQLFASLKDERSHGTGVEPTMHPLRIAPD
jgi:hypothetical protein